MKMKRMKRWAEGQRLCRVVGGVAGGRAVVCGGTEGGGVVVLKTKSTPADHRAVYEAVGELARTHGTPQR